MPHSGRGHLKRRDPRPESPRGACTHALNRRPTLPRSARRLGRPCRRAGSRRRADLCGAARKHRAHGRRPRATRALHHERDNEPRDSRAARCGMARLQAHPLGPRGVAGLHRRALRLHPGRFRPGTRRKPRGSGLGLRRLLPCDLPRHGSRSHNRAGTAPGHRSHVWHRGRHRDARPRLGRHALGKPAERRHRRRIQDARRDLLARVPAHLRRLRPL